MTDLEQAEHDLARAQERLRCLEEDRFEREQLPRLQAKIGSCYRFRNSYSCPAKEADYWWLYAKIVAVAGRHFRVLLVERTNDGKVQARQEVLFACGTEMPPAYQPISSGEWRKAAQEILREASVLIDGK